jgi:hypothetical protein
MILKSKVQVVVVKRGEYGSVAILPDDLFFSPAYPLEEIFDPQEQEIVLLELL